MDRAFQRSHSLMLRGTFYSVPPKKAPVLFLKALDLFKKHPCL